MAQGRTTASPMKPEQVAATAKKATAKAKKKVAQATTMAKERLFADPARPNSYAAGGDNQIATAANITEMIANIKKNPNAYLPPRATVTKPSTTNVPGYVPAGDVGWVQAAASGTGLPATVVAAQIQDESGFSDTAVSPKGAKGRAQFMPATFKQYGPPGGNPENPNDALVAYTNYMGTLLKQYNGNVRNALAAYNAGPENLQAGYGYADSILAAAGAPRAATAGGSSGYGGTRPGGEPSAGDSGGGGGSGGGDDTGQGVATLFANYENIVDQPRTAPQSTFTAPRQAGVSAPFAWWWQSFSGAYAQEEGDDTSG